MAQHEVVFDNKEMDARILKRIMKGDKVYKICYDEHLDPHKISLLKKIHRKELEGKGIKVADTFSGSQLKVHGIQIQDSLGFVKIFIDAQTLKNAKLKSKSKNIDLEHEIRISVQKTLEGI